MERQKLGKILDLHSKWYKNEKGGERANLCEADLYGANLYGANLYGADLYGANLCEADLRGANLCEANLYGADLYGANLYGANLYGANLYGANLYGAKIEFYNFPSIRTLSSIQLGKISDDLTLELMRRDMKAHPFPERFEVWANGGECPYVDEERFWFFEVRREVWKAGDPVMSDKDLIINICKEKGWKIRGVKF